MKPNYLQIEDPSDTDRVLRPRVQCIDDDPDISWVIEKRVRPLGADVIRSFSGRQAVQSMYYLVPDVVILDLVMSDGDGFYVLEYLRENSELRQVPVILLTGRANSPICGAALDLGVRARLSKPIDFPTLIDALQRYVPLQAPLPTVFSSPADSGYRIVHSRHPTRKNL
jgi:CheY-like chemotaxis protein